MASPGSAETSGATIAALLMLQRFSLELSRNAEAALGPSSTADFDLQLLLAVHRSGGAGPSELVELLGRPRSSVARALARLLDQGLTVRATGRPDARRALLRLTAAGEGRVDRFVAATSRTFTSNEPKVAALLLLFGRDPQAAASRGAATTVLAAAERLAAAEAAFTEELVPAMEVFGLRQASDRAGLLVIRAHPKTRPTLLARQLGLSPAGVTSLVDRLVSRGTVVRERGVGADGRAVMVRSTPRGRRAAKACVAVFGKHEEWLLDALELTLGHESPDAP